MTIRILYFPLVRASPEQIHYIAPPCMKPKCRNPSWYTDVFVCNPGYPRLFNPLISVGGSSCYSSRSQCIDFNWAGLVVSVAVMVVVLHEDGLVCAVSGEGNAGDTEAGEDTLETVEATEGAGVSPGLTANGLVRAIAERSCVRRTSEPKGPSLPRPTGEKRRP